MTIHPATYFITILGALVLIPSWPYAIIVLYGILIAFFNALNAREMRDLSYTFSLPVSRRDMVRARVLMTVIIELIMTAIMTLCACLRLLLGINDVAAMQPMVGMPANVALIGLCLIIFGVFNLTFFARYFRNPMKVGISFFIACVPTAIVGCLFEAIPFIPQETCRLISAPGFGHIEAQLIALLIGVAAFIALSALGTKIASRAFTTYDA